MTPPASAYSVCSSSLQVGRNFYGKPRPFFRKCSIQMKLLELPMLGADPPHRPGDRAHHDRLGGDDLVAKSHALEQRPIRDTGRGEQAVALHHVADLILLARISDAHFRRALALFVVAQPNPPL